MTEQLSVKLGLDIIYVYGTVNGVEATLLLLNQVMVCHCPEGGRREI